MSKSTTLIELAEWAGDLELTEVWRVDPESAGWERSDGERVIETAGDFVWSHEEGFEEKWKEHTTAWLTANSADDEGHDISIKGESHAEMAAELPESFRGSIKVYDDHGFARGWIGRHDDGSVSWTAT